MKSYIFLLFVGCIVFSATPIAAQSQSRDEECAAITAEVDANKAKLAELEKGAWWARKQEFTVCCDPAAFLGSAIVLGARTVQKASENKEIADLQQRQEVLAKLAEQHCAPASAPVAKTAKKAKRH